MNISHISVSRKQLFDECPQKYKYQYHLKLEHEEPEPYYFIYGTLIHKIAEEYVKGRGKLTLESITSSVLNGDIPVEEDKAGNPVYAPKLELEYKKRLPEHLRAIKKLSDQIGLDGHTEYKFKYDLDPPNGKFVVGVIDRLIQRGDHFFIIDYKTTKKGMWRKDSRSILTDLQLRCYSRVVQKEFKVPAENIKAALYYVEGGNLIGAKFSHQALVDAENELLSAHKQIEAMPPEAAWGNVGRTCRFCAFRRRCPFYSLT
jgi:RecB family exonuclease